MAMKRTVASAIAGMPMLLTALLMAIAACGQALGPAPTPACSSDLSPYEPCLPAVTGADPSEPTSACCAALKIANIPCLCSIVASNNISNFNVQAAKIVLKRCQVVTPGTVACGLTPPPPPARKLMQAHYLRL